MRGRVRERHIERGREREGDGEAHGERKSVPANACVGMYTHKRQTRAATHTRKSICKIPYKIARHNEMNSYEHTNI